MTWDLDDVLRELAKEDPPEAALAAVRARVMAEVSRPRRTWWYWAVVPVLASAAVLTVWLWPVERPALTPPPAITARMPAPPLAPRLVSVRRPAPVARPEPRILPTGDPNFVRIQTGNPDVVILWSLNSEGEEE